MKTIVAIEWENPEDQHWLCPGNIEIALHAYCRNTRFRVSKPTAQALPIVYLCVDCRTMEKSARLTSVVAFSSQDAATAYINDGGRRTHVEVQPITVQDTYEPVLTEEQKRFAHLKKTLDVLDKVRQCMTRHDGTIQTLSVTEIEQVRNLIDGALLH